jgi:DNA-binding CsgD family transcriptional regulator
MNEVMTRFFEPLQPVVLKKKGAYQKFDYVFKLLDCMDDILHHNGYIIDYCKKNYIYISKQSLFLCGYTEDEVKEWGYQFYEKILSTNDLSRLLEINEVGFKFFYEIPIDRRKDSSISYDLIFHRKDGSTICVNHQLKPFLFTDDGNIWMAVCCIRLSHNTLMGNVMCYFKDAGERYMYSFETKKWQELPPILLTDPERLIVMETNKGAIEKELATRLGCSRNNVQYYKHQILKKTNTTNIREAIIYLYANGII